MKKIKYLLFSIVALFAFNGKVFAGASIYTNKSQVSVGSSFTATMSLKGVASWSVRISATGPVSGCSGVWADTTADGENGSKNYSVSCKATGTGTIKVSISGNVSDRNFVRQNISGTATVNVVANSTPTPQPVVKDNRSGNNNLKSLSVEGYEISPKFDSSKKEYTLNLTYDITKIKIKAEKEHNKASISGDTGEKEVKVGDNNFSITVKAENGNTKTYKLKVIVDSKPIKVTIDGKEYTVIKKKEELPELKIEHEDTELNIEEQNVPAYRIDKIGYILIGLQDSEKNINLYKFISYKNHEKPDEYHLFKYIEISNGYFLPIEFPKDKIPANYSKYEEEINGIKVTVYKLNKSSKYSLIYGTNILTGNINIYRYDSNEKTIQIYEREEAKDLEELIENGKKLVLILGGVILFLIILTTIGFSRKPKTKKIKEKNDLSDSDIKRIEKDTSKSNKKELKRQKKLEKKKLKKGEPEL